MLNAFIKACLAASLAASSWSCSTTCTGCLRRPVVVSCVHPDPDFYLISYSVRGVVREVLVERRLVETSPGCLNLLDVGKKLQGLLGVSSEVDVRSIGPGRTAGLP